ncbi:MAG: hypothetical protein ACRDID_12575, partial [Ktedonobacterales bacterium]
ILDRGRVIAQGPPAQIKAQFSGAKLTLDAADRAALRRELTALGTPFEERDGFHIALDGRLSAHELTRALTTPLTVIQTQQASLEEVYLRILANDDHSS